MTHGNVRLVLPRDTADADVDEFCRLLPVVVARLRRETGVEGL